MLDEKDLKILSALIEVKEPVTSYKIYQITGITLTSVNYKLKNFVMCGLVNSALNGDKKSTVYKIHSLFKCDECMIAMGKLIQKQTDIIDQHEHIPVEGVKLMLDFIIQRVNIVEA